MYFMADMPAIRLARASQSPRRATYVLMPASKLIRSYFDKSNKRASGAGDTLELLMFEKVPIKQYLEHEQKKEGKKTGSKTISFPKGKGHLTHNNREFISNNVVPERTDWNRIYIQESLEQAYEKCFGQALMEYNAGQKRKDRRKENYLKEIENSGNKEKTFYENIVQIGKRMTLLWWVQMESLLRRKAAIEILEQYAKTFQERNPNLYLFNCVMHLDEATPHLHIDYIPVANGYKTGMKTRNSLTKALQQMGFAKAVSKRKMKQLRGNKESEPI